MNSEEQDALRLLRQLAKACAERDVARAQVTALKAHIEAMTAERKRHALIAENAVLKAQLEVLRAELKESYAQFVASTLEQAGYPRQDSHE